jgi:ribonuclease HIII
MFRECVTLICRRCLLRSACLSAHPSIQTTTLLSHNRYECHTQTNQHSKMILLYSHPPKQHNVLTKRIKSLSYRSSDPIDIERSIVMGGGSGNRSSSNSNRVSTAQTTSKYKFVIGTDESGTGCIAGPIIVVSCCIVQQLLHYLSTCSAAFQFNICLYDIVHFEYRN